LAWVKIRSGADDHRLANIVTGGNKHLKSNATDAESTGTNIIQAFSGSTFTLGSDGAVNGTGSTYVAWSWAGNGAGSSNTQGTITSTVSANTTAGFSIVKFNAGSAGNKTIGHGLGVVPAMIIAKPLQSSGFNWLVWHKSLPSSTQSYLLLNSTSAYADDSQIWANTAPTSTVVSRESGYALPVNEDAIMYCFAEVAGYSAFGKYTGNGSSDGPFIYTGFRPKYVLIKPSSAADNWQVEDAARSPFNVVNDQLWPNLSDAEQVDSTTRQTDFVSNGFKIRGTNTGVNGNGTTYIYAAFAEFPFKYTLAR
jgi:hypothetical protein